MTAGGRAELHLGDSLEVLARLPEGSADSLVTDPPAGISLSLGKAAEWDREGGIAGAGSGRESFVAGLRAILERARRVLKPGSHALVWAMPRTSHWTATAVEDAGFEVRDVVVHAAVRAAAAPMGNVDVSKSVDKHLGAERRPTGRYAGHAPSRGWAARYGQGVAAAGLRHDDPATEEAAAWDGWGTKLRSVAEHWILARAPMPGTIAESLLDGGVGAINLRGCRDEFGRLPSNYLVFHGGKVDPRERDEAGPMAAERWNWHPTVKPLDLMQWLVRLATPPGGVVLDPFMGSGSTGVAALREGMRFVGIEREPDYFKVAEERIERWHVTHGRARNLKRALARGRRG